MNTPDAWPETMCVCTAVRRADRALTRVYDDALRPSGLATTQYSLLSIISRAPAPLSLGNLAGAQMMDRTTLTRALAPLVRDGLVDIIAGGDRRTRIISLTSQGQSTLEAARPFWRQAQDRVTRAAGEDRLQHLLAELAEVMAEVRQHGSA